MELDWSLNYLLRFHILHLVHEWHKRYDDEFHVMISGLVFLVSTDEFSKTLWHFQILYKIDNIGHPRHKIFYHGFPNVRCGNRFWNDGNARSPIFWRIAISNVYYHVWGVRVWIWNALREVIFLYGYYCRSTSTSEFTYSDYDRSIWLRPKYTLHFRYQGKIINDWRNWQSFLVYQVN